MKNTILSVLALACATVLLAGCSTDKCESKTPVDYVNTYIGHVSHMLVPCYPTVFLPHSMLRVFPCRREYTTELVDGLPLWVTSHLYNVRHARRTGKDGRRTSGRHR